ncbi:MAG: DUF4190 domain-containing protein [Planctomycetota bacterium]
MPLPTRHIPRERPPVPASRLATAGFVISLISLILACVGGCVIAPIGLTLSIIATTKRPGGLSIAGIVMGALGSMYLLAFIGGFGVMMFAFRSAAVRNDDLNRIARVHSAVAAFLESQHRLPLKLDEIRERLPTALDDQDTNALIHYTRASDSVFILRTPGLDAEFGNSDDSVRVFDLSSPPR